MQEFENISRRPHLCCLFNVSVTFRRFLESPAIFFILKFTSQVRIRIEKELLSVDISRRNLDVLEAMVVQPGGCKEKRLVWLLCSI
mgnify:CR=1 FL=1